MKRSAGTKWDLDRDLGAPEDEFFGLLEEDELPGEEPSAEGRTTGKPSLLQKIIHALVLKDEDSAELEIESLDDVIVEVPERPTPRPGDLEEHIIRLPSGREWDEFLQAEQEESLFENIQETKRKRLRVSSWALWISALIWAFLGFKYGSQYLTDLTSPDIVGGQWLIDKLGDQAAQGITVTSGVLAPVAGFLLSASSIALLLGGAYERRPMRAILGVCGLIALVLSLSLAGGAYYVAALIVASLGWLSLRGLEWLMIRLGAY